jgi:hypothetical protein
MFSKMIKNQFLAFGFVVTFGIQAAQAQTTDSQAFTVRVPQNISISAPSDVLINHDLTNADQAFGAQAWDVRGNTPSGVTVNFSVTSPFTNQTNNTFKRDARLSLVKGTTTGTANWTVTTATDQTNYTGSDNGATVTASSDGAGRANMLLTVTFVTGDIGSVLAGDYVTTVTGTVTAN